MKKFPHYRQLDAMDCGPSCLRMVAKYWGKSYTLQTLREKSFITREGVSMLGISDAAEAIGFRTTGVRVTLNQLREEVPLPCILHWNQNHFVVLYDVKRRRGKYVYRIADPATQNVDFNEQELRKCWAVTVDDGEASGAALVLNPSPEFFTNSDEENHDRKSLAFFLRYLSPYKRELLNLLLGLLTVSLLQLAFPFLTQSLVDIGIRDGNIGFITLVLVAQLILSVSQLSVEFIRSWILLHMNTRINISLISDFLIKLMKLPLRFFDTKMIGDVMQRIGDHRRIETFLTGSAITTLFSFLSFIIFGLVLIYYNPLIFGIFVLGNTLYVLWILVFMKYRRELDIRRFAQASGEQSSLIQMITAMQEIKLNNSERQKRWQWERIQAKLFKIGVKGLALGQVQQVGSVFFNQTTNIIISFIAAKAVVDGQMTLGMMMSLTYIIGQLNAPISSFINFAQQFQDAKISLERLNEIHDQQDEEQSIGTKLNELPIDHTLTIDHVSFSYDGSDQNHVLRDISLNIPQNKVTAIVGASGSGKTTLLKLLLGFYEPNHGRVYVGNSPLSMVNPYLWRRSCGAVMQVGFIFSDTIANNIAIGVEHIDKVRLRNAVMVANIKEFIESLPLGYNTIIGMEGNGISQGQKQRLLIARAVYKNPEYLFFDEATNSLDANNEREIMNNLHSYFKGRTVVIVAHRLSTVRNADRIIVLDEGRLAEEGTHEELTEKQGLYYTLVKNQLELGK